MQDRVVIFDLGWGFRGRPI